MTDNLVQDIRGVLRQLQNATSPRLNGPNGINGTNGTRPTRSTSCSSTASTVFVPPVPNTSPVDTGSGLMLPEMELDNLLVRNWEGELLS